MGLIEQLAALNRAYGGLEGLALLRAALTDGPFKGRTALVSSFGAESAVLLDMVASVDKDTPVILLDSGKLFGETLDYRDELVELLGLRDVRTVRPRPFEVERADPDGGLHALEPDLCCRVRKTEPLEGALAGFGAWITGRKRFQGNLRSYLPSIEGDLARGRVKLNPLATWEAGDLEAYRRLRGLPPHPLVEQGYRSIGCAPCTRPVGPNEDPRAGRWWGIDKTECGIHGDGEGI